MPDRESLLDWRRSLARRFRSLRPGRLSYREALALQEDLVAPRRREAAEDVLVLVEHRPGGYPWPRRPEGFSPVFSPML